jgi:uncharacterized protein
MNRMPLLINLRQVERRDLVLQGELTAEELDLVNLDELIRFASPLEYDLVAQRMEGGVLVQGELRVVLACECSRCLKPFEQALELKDWACHLALEGEEAAVVKDDCVDLTPYLREDILLELPQRPLCRAECEGLPKAAAGKTKKTNKSGSEEGNPSAWNELNKLKF